MLPLKPPQLIIFFICLHTFVAEIQQPLYYCIGMTDAIAYLLFVGTYICCTPIATGLVRRLICSLRRWTRKLADWLCNPIQAKNLKSLISEESNLLSKAVCVWRQLSSYICCNYLTNEIGFLKLCSAALLT